MPDADLDHVVPAIAASAFGCSGERCMAGSIAVPVGNIARPLVERLCRSAESLRVGPTDGCTDVDMGPVITRQHRDRVASYLERAGSEGATVALDGRRRHFDGEGFLIGPSVVDEVAPGSTLAMEEVFGPLLSVVRAASLDEALALGRRCPYGNGASIFTAAARRPASSSTGSTPA